MSFLSGLFGGGKSTSAQNTAAAGLQVQTSVQGRPIALCYGTTRIAPNLIWYGNFTATQQAAGGAGKGGLTGGGGKGGGSGSYLYSASFIMALCEGPINTVNNVYIDKNITDLATAGLSQFLGEYQQAPWSFLLQSEGQIVNEFHAVPASSAYTVTTTNPFLYDNGVIVTTTTPLVYTDIGGINPILEGQYGYTVGQNTVTYYFNNADIGKNVVINYTNYNNPLTQESTVVDGGGAYGTVTINGIFDSGLGYVNPFVDQGVVYIVGSPLMKVSGAPASGEYNEASGIYTFNSAQASANVFISYVPNNGTSQALGYSGIAYVAAANYALGNNPSLSNFNFEVQGKFSNEIEQSIQGEQYTLAVSGASSFSVYYQADFIADEGVTDQSGNVFLKVANSPATNQYSETTGVYTFSAGNAGALVNINYSASVGPDANPADVLYDILTNAHYGVGIPISRVDAFTTYEDYCIASGLLISPIYNSQGQASAMLDDISKATNSAFVWSSGKLKIIPYGDKAITANGHTYTPPASPEYSLGDDDFMDNTNASGGSSGNVDPVLLTRKQPSDQWNSIQLEWLDRGNNYTPAIIEAKDQAAINTFGLRRDGTRTFHMFCNGNAARVSVQLQLQRETVRNIYQFTLDQRYVLLDPMDIVAITDARMGLINQWVRILEITENDDASLSFVAEEYLQGTGTAPLYSYQSGLGFNANYNISPGNVNTPVLFEPTAELAEALAVYMAVSGGSLWGGCQVWISTDGETYQQVGKITGGSRQGFVDAALAAIPANFSGLTIDMLNTLQADLSLSGGQLLNASQADANNYATLCYLGSGNNYELLSYQNSVLISTDFYALTYLVRGGYDSPILSHIAGEQFARIDASIFQYQYTQNRIGTNLYIKLPSFNVYGSGQQSLSEVDPFIFQLQGVAYSSPLPTVQNFRTSYVAGITQLNWDEVTDFRPVQYEVRKGTSWSGAQVLGRVAHPPFNVQGNGTYWVSAYSQPLPGLQVYSEEPVEIIISGAQLVSNVLISWNEGDTGWTGTLGGGAIKIDGNILTIDNIFTVPNIFIYDGSGLIGIGVIGIGDILADPNILTTSDIFTYGATIGEGTYTIPDDHDIDVGYIAACSLIISWVSFGQHINDNILTVVDYLNFQDILDSSANALVNVYPNIAISQDGTTYGDWFKWSPGFYVGRAFKAQMVLQTFDPTVEALLEEFIIEVDVPDRDDQYTNISIASGGLALVFKPNGAAITAPFNGGPNANNLPAVQVTILNAVSGDTVSITSLTKSGCTVQILNGGVGVARNVNILAQGY